jgi:hypothetical protein
MKMYYWSDPAGLGWDIVAQADSEIAAKSIAKDKISLETLPGDFAKIGEAIELGRPTGTFHYPAAICIFTECDPVESRISREALTEIVDALKVARTWIPSSLDAAKRIDGVIAKAEKLR